MFAFPSLSVANLHSITLIVLTMLCLQGCTQERTSKALPPSAFELESQLQTARLIRYSFPDGSDWQGWVLRTEAATKMGIAVFDSEPTVQDWEACIRQQSQTHTLKTINWLSSTMDTLSTTKQYAFQMNATLPIIQVDC